MSGMGDILSDHLENPLPNVAPEMQAAGQAAYQANGEVNNTPSPGLVNAIHQEPWQQQQQQSALAPVPAPSPAFTQGVSPAFTQGVSPTLTQPIHQNPWQQPSFAPAPVNNNTTLPIAAPSATGTPRNRVDSFLQGLQNAGATLGGVAPGPNQNGTSQQQQQKKLSSLMDTYMQEIQNAKLAGLQAQIQQGLAQRFKK